MGDKNKLKMETLEFKDKRYTVVRVIKFESLVDDNEAKVFRDHCHAETILKRNGHYYFCNEISDAVIIKESLPPQPPQPIQTPS